ncbi:hypothetical protein DID80_00245 [Candidatus Marinamargulisbacteria bacterium SCGC AAA071-K20]|nr:hypothetical protein DID80_00245 [Candidatus Marinamargulisbacteria bacterium SCGC AAA071-K20]
MRRSYFFEGLCFGAIIGLILGYFFDIEEETKKVIDKASNVKLSKEESSEPESEESAVAKTLEAIEHGFEKLSNMVDQKKDS